MKKRFSEQPYHPARRPGISAPWRIAVFERWACMRRMDALRAVGCRSFSFVPSGTILALAIEYTGSHAAGWALADWY